MNTLQDIESIYLKSARSFDFYMFVHQSGFFFNILEQIVTTQSDIPDQASYVMEVKVYDDCRLTQTGTVTLTVPNTVNYTIIRRTQNILDSWKNKTLQPAQSLSRILVHQKPLFQS